MIYYEKKIKSADAEWLVLFHGLGGSLRTWKNQISEFEKKYNLFLFDLDGHGRSDFDETETDYKPSQMARTLNQILVSEGIFKFNIVAFSMGTAVALEYMKFYPEKIGKVTLAGLIINCNMGRRLLFRYARFLSFILPVKLSYKMCARVLMPKKSHKIGRDFFVREAMKFDKRAFSKWIEKFGATPKKVREYVELINEEEIPVIIILGEEDYMFINGAIGFYKQINNAEMKILENSGHVCLIEKKEMFNQEVMCFFETKK